MLKSVLALKHGAVFKYHRGYRRWIRLTSPKKIALIMLETFVGPKPNNKEACHRDDNRSNNHIDNLYWGTRSQNVSDAWRNGMRPENEKIFSDEEVVALYVSGMSLREIAEIYRVNYITIRNRIPLHLLRKAGRPHANC